MRKNITYCIIIVFLSLSSIGCIRVVTPGNYNADEIGQVKKVQQGIVIAKRPIQIVRKNTEGTFELTVNNATVIGPEKQHGYEYVIQLRNGNIVSVTQNEDMHLKIKQPVLIIDGNVTRVVPDER